MIQQQKQLVESLPNSRIARLATGNPENNHPYLVPVVFAFDGNNIFIPIDDKTKRVNSNQLKRVKIYKKIPIVISSIIAGICGCNIVYDIKYHSNQRNKL